jgi:phosphatidylinositol 3-kinase
MTGNEFRFFLSCDINLPVTFRIERLEGNYPFPKSPNSGLFLLLLIKFTYISNFEI